MFPGEYSKKLAVEVSKVSPGESSEEPSNEVFEGAPHGLVLLS